MKDKLFQIFFCIYLFWENILYTYLGSQQMDVDGTIMRYALVGIAVLSWLFYFSYSRRSIKELTFFFILFVFGALYLSTEFRYLSIPDSVKALYKGQFLRWGADCVSASVIGMTLLKQKDYSLIHKVLPWMCIALTPFMTMSVIGNASDYGQYSIEGGYNYQRIAYSMAVLCCFSLYYLFIIKENKTRILKLLLAFTLLVQAVICCMSGGRGGVVLLVVYCIYIAYYAVKNKIITLPKLVILSFFVIIAFLVVSNQFNLWSSAGFARSSGLAQDNDRFLLWAQMMPFIKERPILGWGLGGDYFSFGFYTHNFIVDWLLETGFVGLIFFSIMYLKTYKSIFLLSKSDDVFCLVLIIFIYAVVLNFFSGYWLSNSHVWLSFSVVYCSEIYVRTLVSGEKISKTVL